MKPAPQDPPVMGIIEDPEDIKECLQCKASIMPWHTRCEACGTTFGKAIASHKQDDEDSRL